MSTNTQRTPENIVVTITKKFDAPPLPYELHGHIAPDTWDFRFRQIHILCNQYSKPLFERIWLLISILATFVLPIVLYGVVFNAITPKPLRDALDRQTFGNSPPSNRFDGNVDDAIGKYSLETRGIIFAVLVGVFLVFWLPLIVWKALGTVRANAMTRRWEEEDRTRGATFISRWTVTTPGIITLTGTTKIPTPPNPPPSTFHPYANIPSFIAQQPSYDGYNYQSDNKELVAPAYFPHPDYVFAGGDEKQMEGFYDVKA